MTAQRNTNIIYGLGSAVLLPSLPLYLGIANSFAIGTVLAASTIIALSHSRPSTPPTTPWNKLSGGTIAACIALPIILHLLSSLLWQKMDLSKSIPSIALLPILIYGAYFLAKEITASDTKVFSLAVRAVSAVLVTTAIVAAAGLQPQLNPSFHKALAPFTEPSHFAIAISPLLIYNAAIARKHAQHAWLILGFVLGGALENVTLIICAMIAAIACTRNLKNIALIAATLAILLATVNLDYFTERINFGEEATNLSTLVYIQGWQLIEESLNRTEMFGLGFQQLGANGTDVAAAQLINAIVGNDLNLQDGGFLFAKITSEFGIFGLLLVGAYLIQLSISFKTIRSAQEPQQNNEAQSKTLFCHSIVVGFFPVMFLRSGGYFSGSTLLMLCAMIFLLGNTKKPHVSNVTQE